MRKFGLLVLMVLLTAGRAWTQSTVDGRIVDAKTGEPVEYATIALLRTADSSLATGAVTNEKGYFQVKALQGRYLLRVSFMGYSTYFHPEAVVVGAKTPAVHAGKIQISPAAVMMDAVVVKAERTLVEYQLDKRVVNVDKNIVTGGGTATDVLETVPSVAIDNDGNVTLRGSTNVKVLIDGRPYELMGSDLESLLEQIPASTVENVEIITNPSAKYDPEGMSGIINIKLKDKPAGSLGLNGVVNLNAGAPLPFVIKEGNTKFIPTTMGSANLNYSTEKYNLFFSADGGMRSRAHQGTTFIERRRDGAPYSADSLFSFGINRNYMGSVKAGGEYYFDKQNSLLLSYSFRGGNRQRLSQIDDIDCFSSPAGLLNYHQADTSTYRNLNHSANLLYIHKFDEAEHQLTIDAAYTRRRGSGRGGQRQEYGFGEEVNRQHFYYRESPQQRASHNVNLKMNYARPVADKYKLEAGYEGQMRFTDQRYEYYTTRYAGAEMVRQFDSMGSMSYSFGEQAHALYATFGGKVTDKFSAQAGLRGEYSNVYGRNLTHPEAEQTDKNYWQCYPTLHLQYEFGKGHSLQFSYSRRVRRPSRWDLHPNLNVREGKELSFGNPGLAPEFTNAFELSYNVALEKANIFTSAYFRQTDSMMTRYGFVWDGESVPFYAPWIVYNPAYDGYWASTWQNLSKGINAGLELIVDWQLLKWWRLNASVNLYDSYIEGTPLLNSTDRNAFRAGGKLSSFMTLPRDWTIQFSGQYNAPFMDLQTDMTASYWFDLAVKKDVLGRRGSVSLRVGDIFCTGGFGHTTNNEQLYRVMRSRRISPTITVGFSYKINNGLKQKPKQNTEEEQSDGEY